MTKIKPEVKVVVSKNGPYLVTGDVPLAKQTIVSDAEGGSQAWKRERSVSRLRASYALCRCGHSKNKPFCDGTHSKIKFDGTETASRAPVPRAGAAHGRSGARPDATRSRCAPLHASATRTARSGARSSTPTSRRCARNFVRQVNNCPSAARLVAWDRATGQPIEHALPVSIGLIEDPAEECQRSAVAARRDTAGVGRRLRLRDPQPRHPVPLRRLQEQALLRRLARGGEIPRLKMTGRPRG